jgi:hypothetical protein
VLRIRTILDRIRNRLLKSPDPDPFPDPGLNKFLANVILEFFLMKIGSKNRTKKLNNRDTWSIYGFYCSHTKNIGPFIKTRIRIRPNRSGSDLIRIRNTVARALAVCQQIIEKLTKSPAIVLYNIGINMEKYSYKPTTGAVCLWIEALYKFSI